MKPRNKLERKIVAMADSLRPLTEVEKKYARSLFPAEALYFSRRGNHCEFHCMCCGYISRELGKWPYDESSKDTWTCPECGAECTVLQQYSGGFSHNRNPRTGEYSKSPTGSRYVTLLDRHDGYQVLRTFDVLRWNSRTTENGIVVGMPTEFRYYEIYQVWIGEDGKETITSRSYVRGVNFHTWYHNSPWSIGVHNDHCTGYYQMCDVFDNAGNFFFPRHGITPLLRRNGLNANVVKRLASHIDIGVLAIKLLTNNTFEELVKTGQLEIVRYFLGSTRGRKLEDHLRQIRICTRHGYKIKRPSLWLDYLDDLVFLGMDTHSPKYLCPKNISEAHQVTLRRRLRIEKAKEKERKRKEAREYERLYYEAKAPFLGISLHDDSVTISVLRTVKDVFDEGEAMHHCVFDN